MPNSDFFKPEFDALAKDGCIGHPTGRPAYAYIRVSDSEQAEEGRSGLPRQIMHIHEVALEKGYRIPWALVFADDHTGFEFNDRPALLLLRKEFKSPGRRANAVVMEYLDRLSRNADWHQGFLLDEMKTHGVETIFWKPFRSRIERAVMGAISQEGMEQAKERMYHGLLDKARSGRVTARTPRFGFKLVDSKGREGSSARKDTHYAIKEDEARIIRFIYEQIAYHGATLRGLAVTLQKQYPRTTGMWEHSSVRAIVVHPIYKGVFIAHRITHVKVPKYSREGELIKYEHKQVIRPEEEWIRVPVPPIVTAELWEQANRIVDQNMKMAKRNGKRDYMMTGIIRCATCGYTYFGQNSSVNQTLKSGGRVKYYAPMYRCCTVVGRAPHVKEKIGCKQGSIACSILDPLVWSVLSNILLDPQILIGALEKQFSSETNTELYEQIRYVEGQIVAKDSEDEKLYRAYQADVFDEQEYAGRRRMLKAEQQTLQEALEKLRAQVMTQEALETRRQQILMVCEEAKKQNWAEDAPMDVKRNVIKMVVDRIVLNVNEGWFRIEGVVNGTYSLKPPPPSEPSTNPDPPSSPSGGGSGDSSHEIVGSFGSTGVLYMSSRRRPSHGRAGGRHNWFVPPSVPASAAGKS